MTWRRLGDSAQSRLLRSIAPICVVAEYGVGGTAPHARMKTNPWTRY
jgi:hypothetical protein